MAEIKLLKVTDIIDLEYLQKIQDGIGLIAGITTVLLDPQGEEITQPTNMHAFCAAMYAKEGCKKICNETNFKLIEENKITREQVIVSCPHTGLRLASVPIFLGNIYLGSWIIRQIRMEDVDKDVIEREAMNTGMTKAEVKKNLAMLPVVSEEEFHNVVDFLAAITGTLANLVEMGDKLKKKDDDIAELSLRLDDSFKTFRDFISLTDLGAFVIDYETGKIIMCNESFRETFGLKEDELKEVTCFNCMGYREQCWFCPKDKLIDKETGEPRLDSYIWEVYNEKTGKWFSENSRGLKWIDGRIVIMTTFTDITNRKAEEERMAYLAYNDQRLEIPNGVRLTEDLTKIDSGTFMTCFDVQGLRKINDVYGRDAGDNLLKSIVAWFKQLSDKNVQIYRIEGDDFAVLIKNSTEEKAMEFAHMMLERFEHAWDVDMSGIRQDMYAGVHVGVIEMAKPVNDQSALLTIVERVLSIARKEGKLIYFDKMKNEEIENHMHLEMRLKYCVLNHLEGFSLNYQPIVKATTGQWVGLEALCRWTDNELGIVPPDIFIREAEQLGLINIISDWVMEEAIRQVKEWKLDELPDFVLDINLSPLQLDDRNLLPKTLDLLNKYDFPRAKLSLEITETAEVSFDEKTIKTLNDIREAGISLSLDDFGSGYATFSTLKNLPVNALKTDRSFVNGIEEDDFLQYTTRIMFDFAHAAGMSTIAEGVETEIQREIMARNGVNMIQGYYFSRPLPKEELAKKLGSFQN